MKANIEDEIRALAEKLPKEVVQQIAKDELVWNKCYKWHYYDWTGNKTGRVVQLTPKVYQLNGTGPQLTEEQFREKRAEYILDRLKQLALPKTEKKAK